MRFSDQEDKFLVTFADVALYPSKAGDPYDSRHQCDPAAPTEADGPGASCLQRRVPQPSPVSPDNPVQHRRTHNPHCPTTPAGTDRQHCLTPTGVVFSLHISLVVTSLLLCGHPFFYPYWD